MNKFERISSFEKLSENDSRKLYGGEGEPEEFDTGTKKTVSCTVLTQTSGGTCNNNVPDNCSDSGQGTECVPD